jgi:hypothetical protein
VAGPALVWDGESGEEEGFGVGNGRAGPSGRGGGMSRAWRVWPVVGMWDEVDKKSDG